MAIVLGIFAMPAPALADHTVQNVGTYTSPINFYFNGNPAATDNSVLEGYFTDAYTGVRYLVSARSGSGDGSTNPCYSNHGWLPAGYYGRDDNDANSRMDFIYKDWGETVVRGYVWSLGDKTCNGPGTTLRTALYIHSNGIEGTAWNYNWHTQGCIKVSQHARTGFVSYWITAVSGGGGRLIVYHS